MKPARLFVILLFLCFCRNAAEAQSIDFDGCVSHWEGDLRAGLNKDGYDMEFSIIHFAAQYVGLKFGIGFAGEYEEVSWGDDDWYLDTSYTVRFKFNPALVFRTPRIITWKKHDAGFYLFGEPGVVLSPGASGSSDARWLCWDFKCGINLQVSEFVVSLGYGVSNFSLYSGRPSSHWMLPDNTNYNTHSVFLGAAYKF